MLSGETAKGKYPVQSIETMVSICREAEKVLDHTQTFAALRAHAKNLGPDQINEAICSSAVKTAFDLRASLVLCLTESGRTARLVSPADTSYVPASSCAQAGCQWDGMVGVRADRGCLNPIRSRLVHLIPQRQHRCPSTSRACRCFAPHAMSRSVFPVPSDVSWYFRMGCTCCDERKLEHADVQARRLRASASCSAVATRWWWALWLDRHRSLHGASLPPRSTACARLATCALSSAASKRCILASVSSAVYPTSMRRHIACRLSVRSVCDNMCAGRRPQAICLHKHVMRVGLASNKDRRW